MKKIIITGNAHPYLQESLYNKGYTVIYDPYITIENLFSEIKDAIGLIVTTRIQVDKALIDAAHNLQWIGRLGSGMEQIDVTYANKKGIDCYSSPEGNCNAVAEHTLGMLLNLMNKINSSYNALKNFNWAREESRGEELNGKTVGIIGFGNTGSTFAKLLSAFNVTVLAYDKFKSGFANHYIKEATLQEIFDNADIVSLHIPLTNETKYLANTHFFHSFKKSIYFLNTSRGKITETTALINALEKKQIKGAALDVLENENLNTYSSLEKNQLQQLLSYNNVIITPHIAGITKDAHFKLSKFLVDKLPL